MNVTRERFERYVEQREGCWLWTGSVREDGYGVIRTGRLRLERAHRVSWELAHGPIPKGMSVLHRCDNPPCVNPSHLWLGTQADNVRDMNTKGRRHRPPGDLRHHVPRGERMGKATKLTAADVLAIRARYDAGERYKALSAAFGIGRQQVWMIVRRKSWAHI